MSLGVALGNTVNNRKLWEAGELGEIPRLGCPLAPVGGGIDLLEEARYSEIAAAAPVPLTRRAIGQGDRIPRSWVAREICRWAVRDPPILPAVQTVRHLGS